MINDRDPHLLSHYQDLVAQTRPHSPVAMHCLRAFLIGGLICVFGQGLLMAYQYGLDLDKQAASNVTSMTLVLLTMVLTGLGVYDRIASFAGAGTAVPITGFANAMVSPAMEYRSEGWVTGVGAKLFTIAGPVLVYGVSASVICGLIYALLTGVNP